MTRDQCRDLFQRLRELNPAPTTELVYQSPFELLIAVILSAQATDRSVNQATAVLFAHANTPAAIVALGEERLKTFIRTIGLFNTKARNIIATCVQLLEHHQGEVPRTRKQLQALPGVGRKTANVILNTVFGEPTLAVDTHILRLANRTGLASGHTPAAVEQQLLHIIPEEFLCNAHHWLILHGRYICTARQPRCEQCVIEDLCAYDNKTLPPLA